MSFFTPDSRGGRRNRAQPWTCVRRRPPPGQHSLLRRPWACAGPCPPFPLLLSRQCLSLSLSLSPCSLKSSSRLSLGLFLLLLLLLPLASSAEGVETGVLTTPPAVATSMASYHCQVAAVGVPASTPLPVGGSLSS